MDKYLILRELNDDVGIFRVKDPKKREGSRGRTYTLKGIYNLIINTCKETGKTPTDLYCLASFINPRQYNALEMILDGKSISEVMRKHVFVE